MKYSQDAILKAAREGAAKYAQEQFDVLRQFCAIDCGSCNEEGNAKLLAILATALSPSRDRPPRDFAYSPGPGGIKIASMF